MSELSELERRQKHDRLTERTETLQMWGVRARSLDESAEHIRFVARQLASEVSPLRSAFNTVRTQHTPSAWTGEAATGSRQRLDQHEQRCVSAVRTVDLLIDDLEAEALATSARAADARWHQERTRRIVRDLEFDLSRHR